MPKSPDSRKRAINDYAKYSGMGFSMAIAIGLGVWLGGLADEKYQTEMPYFAALGAIIGLAAVMTSLFKTLGSENKRSE